MKSILKPKRTKQVEKIREAPQLSGVIDAQEHRGVQVRRIGLVEQTENRLDAIIEKRNEYSDKAQKLWNAARELESSGEPDPEIPQKVKELEEQARYFSMLADQKEQERREVASQLNELMGKVNELRSQLGSYRTVLERQKQLLKDEIDEAKRRIVMARRKIKETEWDIDDLERELTELEGQSE
jgi:uncharacterized coiled-coil DUF342 family protein